MSLIKPISKHLDTGDAATAAARPKRARRGAPLREALVRPGRMPSPVPEQVIGALAVVQGLQGELIDRLERLEHSPVLLGGTWTITASLCFERTFKVQFQSIMLANLSANPLTLAPGGMTDPSNPSQLGAGVYVFPTKTWAIVPIVGNTFNVAGLAGSQFRLAVMSRFMPPASGVT